VGEPLELVTLCTGNAARSVMAGFMLEALTKTTSVPPHVVTAGTHTLEDRPMSMRTRDALLSIPEMAQAPVSQHRSHQITDADLDRAVVVIAMEADHVRYVRKRHPQAAAHTATIRHLCQSLKPGSEDLAHRLNALDLAHVVLDDSDDVADPAGREDAIYQECAWELWSLCQELIPLL
jgi:protein-tyrosine-phosphatase